jgi:hypothetical protein
MQHVLGSEKCIRILSRKTCRNEREERDWIKFVSSEHGNEYSSSIKGAEFLDHLSDYHVLKDCAPKSLFHIDATRKIPVHKPFKF